MGRCFNCHGRAPGSKAPGTRTSPADVGKDARVKTPGDQPDVLVAMNPAARHMWDVPPERLQRTPGVAQVQLMDDDAWEEGAR